MALIRLSLVRARMRDDGVFVSIRVSPYIGNPNIFKELCRVKKCVLRVFLVWHGMHGVASSCQVLERRGLGCILRY